MSLFGPREFLVWRRTLRWLRLSCLTLPQLFRDYLIIIGALFGRWRRAPWRGHGNGRGKPRDLQARAVLLHVRAQDPRSPHQWRFTVPLSSGRGVVSI